MTQNLVPYIENSQACPTSIKSIIHSAYQHPVSRDWQRETTLTKSMFIYPIFVSDIPDCEEQLATMPGQKRFGVNKLVPYIRTLVDKGLRSVILFGVASSVSLKDEIASKADEENAPVLQAVRILKKNFPQLFICCDVCLCSYTSHGHCGIVKKDGNINVIKTNKRLAELGLAYANAGADGLAPSDMMDGRVAAIKSKLLEHNLAHSVMVLSYSAKFSSGLYGPFRDAASSTPSYGDRKCYQLPPTSRKLALRAIARDKEEGADVIIVKPAASCLDIIREATQIAPDLPVAAYHVSGEYSMLYYAAQHGLFDLKQLAFEVTEGFLRAGATIIISYFTPDFLDWLTV